MRERGRNCKDYIMDVIIHTESVLISSVEALLSTQEALPTFSLSLRHSLWHVGYQALPQPLLYTDTHTIAKPYHVAKLPSF